jgi:aspartate aminotransferase-like enzyme
MRTPDHPMLVIPGPVEVRQEVLEAQTEWMIGHRSKEFAALFERLQPKLQQAFQTEGRVYILGASGSGFWEAGSRNCIRDDKKVLHLVSGAFSQRWADVSRANGKQVDTIELAWGEAFTPRMVADALQKESYDAVCMVHCETSTGVINPVREVGEIVKGYPDTLFLVDVVTTFMGAELRVDEWGIDLALTSSQKALGLPPGIAFAAVSDRVLARAEEVPHRGFYFDFLVLEKSAKKNNTPTTPPISLMFAADMQLDAILAEGLENRWTRHLSLRDRTHEWALSRGFGLFAPEGNRSPTVTAVANERGIDVEAMAAFMYSEGYTMDRGYGKLRGQTFRIAHMGDMQASTLEGVLASLDKFLAQGQS